MRGLTHLFRCSQAPYLLLFGCALVLVGCAGRTGGLGAASDGSFDVLSGEQVREADVPNLYEAVQKLRPQWLRPRPRTSISFENASEPVVYLQGLPHGSPNTMYSMHVNDVVRVEYVNPIDATTRYGTGHGGGVIEIDLVRY